jgi:Leucine-rich repeat (LRR) protein
LIEFASEEGMLRSGLSIGVMVAVVMLALTLAGCPKKQPPVVSERVPVPVAPQPAPPPRITVNFADPALEDVVRAQLNQPEGELYEDEVKKITSLNARKKNITDLAGIESLSGLTAFDLGGNFLRTITPLAKLTNLTELKLDENFIVDVVPLANLKKLTHLDLSGNEIRDVAPLAGLTSLTVLDLHDNEITDSGALAELQDQGVTIQWHDSRR